MIRAIVKRRHFAGCLRPAFWCLAQAFWTSAASAQLASVIPSTVPDNASALSSSSLGTTLSCADAAAIAEQEAGIPKDLLLAIGRVESGRYDPATGRVAPWPWATNSLGIGHIFQNRDDAISYLRDQRSHGTQSVDVGCFQINMYYHSQAFASDEEAFDPLANARYAASFLSRLYGRTGGWESAVAMYHSAVPEKGEWYRGRVLASWRGGDLAIQPGPIGGFGAELGTSRRSPFSAALPHVADPYVVLMSAQAQAVHVWTPTTKIAGLQASRLPKIITP